MFDSRDTWNIMYIAWSNTCHPPFSPNIAPATQKTETSFTLRGATVLTLQRHQKLCLPPKMTGIIDPHRIWNVMYTARSNRSPPPTSPNIVPATKNDTPKSDRNLLRKAETSFTVRGWSKTVPTMIRESSDHNPRMNPTRRATEVTFRAPRELSLRCSFQISPGTAPARKTGSWHSPNNAPATKSDSHDGSSSQKKCHVPCAEQQKSPSEVTKSWTCHEKLLSC